MIALRCPACGGPVERAGGGARCTTCGRGYASVKPGDFLDFGLDADRPPEHSRCWDDEASRDEIHAAAAVAKEEADTIFVKLPRRLQRLDLAGRIYVDVGCGYGRTLLYGMGTKPAAAVGIDLSAEMLRKARGYAAELGLDPLLVRAPVDRLPLADSSVDVLYSAAVMLHLPKPTVAAVLGEAARVLRPGGTALFEDCFLGWLNPDGLQTRLVTAVARPWLRTAWVRTYSRRELERMVRAAAAWARVEIAPEGRKIAPTVLGPRPLRRLKPYARRLNAGASERLRTDALLVSSWSVELTR